MMKFLLMSTVANIAYKQIDKHINKIEMAQIWEYKALERRKRNMYSSQESVLNLENQSYIINTARKILKRDISILIDEKNRLLKVKKRSNFDTGISSLIESIEQKIKKGKKNCLVAKKTLYDIKIQLNNARYLLELDTACVHSGNQGY